MNVLSEFYTHLIIDLYYKLLIFCTVEIFILVSMILYNNSLPGLEKLLSVFDCMKNYLYI